MKLNKLDYAANVREEVAKAFNVQDVKDNYISEELYKISHWDTDLVTREVVEESDSVICFFSNDILDALEQRLEKDNLKKVTFHLNNALKDEEYIVVRKSAKLATNAKTPKKHLFNKNKEEPPVTAITWVEFAIVKFAPATKADELKVVITLYPRETL